MSFGSELNVRVGVQEPESGKYSGDVVYLTGFADRLDNHRPLFDEWNHQGLRVISFDLPGHGEDSGTLDNINDWTFHQMAEITRRVEQCTRSSKGLPLILSGWSTGGLIAARMINVGSGFPTLERKTYGVVLIAPGVSIRLMRWEGGPKLIGDNMKVTTPTLTSNPCPPHLGNPSPDNLWQISFAARLLYQAEKAQGSLLPKNLPVLVLTGDEKTDVYADSDGVQKWVEHERKVPGIRVTAVSCAGGHHELDNEDRGIGESVRSVAGVFAAASAAGEKNADINSTLGASSPCQAY